MSVLPKLTAPVLPRIDAITAYWRRREQLRALADAFPAVGNLARQLR